MTTRAEHEHLDRVAELGCCVCRREGRGYVPAVIHHLRRNPETGQHLGMSQRSPHKHTIGLCPWHHQQGPMGSAFHAGPRAFEFNHGTEKELWEQVQAWLEMGETA